MADARFTPNPLRPYYVPPSISREPVSIPNSTSAATAKPTSATFSFPDLDYSEYIPDAPPSLASTVRSTLDKAVWKYTSVLVAQPLEVAKVILQVRLAQADDDERAQPSTPNSKYRELYEEHDLDSEDDEPNYFTSSTPVTPGSQRSGTPPRGRQRRPLLSSQGSQASHAKSKFEALKIKDPSSLLEVLSALSSADGPLAMWRATNSTFLYSIINRTVEAFLRSFFAAVIGIAESDIVLSASSSLPDTQILNSTSPIAAVLIATLSTAVSAMLLSPIDTARTRLILTPSAPGPRSLLGALRTLRPSWLIPSHLVPITFLTSSLPTFISTATPLALKSYLRLDPAVNPTSWSVFSFLASVLDLSVKFPLETVLRRAQIATWTSPALAMHHTDTRQSRSTASRSKHESPSTARPSDIISTVVPVPETYSGIVGTIMHIVRHEGHSESAKDHQAASLGKAPRRRQRGQGIGGLYRGWRVGLWGLVGIWGSGFASGITGEGTGAIPNAGKF